MPEHLFTLALCAFAAGLVRGFSGFGLSAVLVASAAFFVSPKLIIPAAQALEIVASIAMLKSVWPDVSWRWLKPMAFGYLFSVPLGIAALTYASATALRILGCIVLLIASLAMLFNFRPNLLNGRDGFALRMGTGLVAGFMSGATSYGGMVASVMLFAVELPAKNLRATLVVMFFLSSIYSLILGAWNGITNVQTITLAGWLAIPVIAGIAFGSRGFAIVTPEQFKRLVLMVLAALSLAGLLSVTSWSALPNLR
jgi:uncharacterized protein